MGTTPTGESAATDLPEMASSIFIFRREYSDRQICCNCQFYSQAQGSLLTQLVTP